MSAFSSRLSLVLIVIALPSLLLAADKPKAEKKPAIAGKVGGQLQKTFKLWDKNKDESVDKEELEKYYARLKPKTAKKGAADAADAPDPLAAVNAMRTKADSDSDGKISKAEFDEWAGKFADYIAKFADLQNQRGSAERELANLERLLARSGNVTAADGIFGQEARRGIITYKQSLERIDGELKALDAEGHSDYRDLLLPQLLR